MTDILIVEDNSELASLLADFLRAEEYTVSIAENGEKALSLFEKYGARLVLLDINLPKMDGFDVCKKVREQSNVPIVMITAIGAHEMQAYRELHCYQYIMKPYTKEQVEAVLEKVLQKENLEKPRTVNIRKDGINYQIRCDEILYIEAIPRGVCIHMKKEDWNLPYVSLKQIMEKLPDEFLQCHRVYVVNKNEIEYTDLVNRMIKLRGVTPMIEIGVTYKGKIGKVVK